MSKWTQNKEIFAQKCVELKNASEAYRAAYSCENSKPETIHSEASRLKADPKVAARILELQNELREELSVTVKSIVKELEDARLHALKDDKGASAAVSASMGKAKVCGLLVDKTELTGKDGAPIEVEDVFAGLSQKEKVRKMEFILRREQEKLNSSEGDNQADGA